MEEFTCSECKQAYNGTNRSPHMIPTCGHTICHECLETSLTNLNENQLFKCSEDEVECGIKDIKQYPFNQSILKFITRRSSSRSLTMHVTPPPVQAQEEFEITTNDNEFIDTTENPNNPENCPLHNKKLELMCLDDYEQICVTCALFGQHKSHNYKPTEEVVRQINQQVTQMMSIYQTLSERINDLNDEKHVQTIKQQFQQSITLSQEQVTQQFNSLINTLQIKQEMILQEIESRFNAIQDDFINKFKRSFTTLNQRAELWQFTMQEKLITLSQKTEAGEIAVEMLHQLGNSNHAMGQHIIEEVEQAFTAFQINLEQVASKKFYVHLPLKLIKSLEDSIQIIQEGDQQQLSRRTSQLEDPNILQDLNEWDQQQPLQQTVNQPSRSNNNSLIHQKIPIPIEEHKYQHHQQQQQQQQASPNFEQSPTQSTSGSSQRRSKTIIQSDLDFDKLSQSSQQQQQQMQKSSRSTFKKLTKNPKTNDKIQELLTQIENEDQDLVEIAQYELGDEGCNALSEFLKGNQKLKVLKLMKNKIGDEGAIKLFSILDQTQLQALHLQNNNIGERALDYFVVQIRKKQQKGQHFALKSLFLNQNNLNVIRTKKKVEEMKKLGIQITL